MSSRVPKAYGATIRILGGGAVQIFLEINIFVGKMPKMGEIKINLNAATTHNCSTQGMVKIQPIS